MSAGSPGDANGDEPSPAPDPWSRLADFGQSGPGAAPPAQPAQPAAQDQPAPPSSEPAGFASPAPAEWSAPAQWTAPLPPPWPGPPDSQAGGHPAGNGFITDSDPAQPTPTAPPAGQYGYPPQWGYPPPGQYGSQPFYAPVAPRTSGLAIAALVCGLVQFFLGLFALNFVLAIPAIICGALGMRRTRERGEGGRGLAIAGLVLGILGIVWNVLYVVLLGYITARFRPGSGPPAGFR